MSKREVEVSIFKSGIPMRGTETVSEFLDLLREALREQVHSDKSTWMWISEVRADSLIVSVDYGEDGDWKCEYFKHQYSRGLEAFEFGEGVEVRRVSTFVEV